MSKLLLFFHNDGNIVLLRCILDQEDCVRRKEIFSFFLFWSAFLSMRIKVLKKKMVSVLLLNNLDSEMPVLHTCT